MAVDTPTKRSSALNVRTRCRRFLPVPDGTITVADRAHLAGVYYEVASVVPEFAITRRGVLIGQSSQRLSLIGQSDERGTLRGQSDERRTLTGYDT